MSNVQSSILITSICYIIICLLYLVSQMVPITQITINHSIWIKLLKGLSCFSIHSVEQKSLEERQKKEKRE